jgi:hypothetical protein
VGHLVKGNAVASLHNELRPLWKKAGYHTKMGSAAVAPPPSVNFKRLYHLTGPEHAVSNIVFSRLKVALLRQLNDPFELLAARFLNNKDIKKAAQEYKDKLAEDYGLLCFSEDWTDPVLWTHYAARHTGICLGFDVPIDLAMKVDYQEDRLKVDGGVLDKELRKKLLRTKYVSWKYENEWRVQVALKAAQQEGPVYFERVGDRIHLAEVILGALCITSVDDMRKLVNMHYRDVVTFQARLANGSFHIVPRERTIPTRASRVHVR